jgi:hypothetical protein
MTSSYSVEGTLGEAVNVAVGHSLSHNMATIISHDGRELVSVIPDVVLLELVANGTVLMGGMVRHRSDGRSVRVIHRG